MFEGFPDFPLGDVERLCLVHGLLPSPVGTWLRLNNAAPSVQPHYRAFFPTTSCSAPVLRFGTLVLAVGAAWTSPLASERQVLTFRTRAWLSFAPSTCRMPLGQASGFSQADPGGRVIPRFRHRLIRFRHFIDGSLALASLNRTCRDHRPSVSAALTTVAFDQSGPRWLGISDLIAEPEGPTFISYKVAHSRLDRLRFVTQDPERTSRCFGLGADIKNFAPELRSNNSSGLRSGTVCWWVAPPHQCVTTMKSVSFPVSWLNPLSEIINEEAGVRSLEILSTVSCGISMRLRTALA